MLKIDMNVELLDTLQRKEKARLVAEEMGVVLNSMEFKINLLRELEKGYEGERSVWRERSPKDIYNHLMGGAEVLKPEVDHTWNIRLDDYFSIKKVIAYTLKNTLTVFMNTKYLDIRPPKLVGSTCTHEHGHKLGFSHDFWNTQERPRSLCYILNKVYELTHEQVIEKQYKLVCSGFWLWRGCTWQEL